MMIKKLALLTALSLGSLPAFAADMLPAGTLITGNVSGAANSLLGLDHLFNDEPGTNTTALVADDLEFITSDYAVGVNFLTNGSVQFFNNRDFVELPGSYTLTFNFDASSPAVKSFTLSDASFVTTGTITPQVLGEHSISISFSDVSTTALYEGFTVQITTMAAAVPEPVSLAMFGAGLGLMAVVGVRRARRNAA